MPGDTKRVRCIQLRIFLSSNNAELPDFYAFAGYNPDEVKVAIPPYMTDGARNGKAVCLQLLRKIAKAMDNNQKTIEICVDRNIIILDE